MNNHRLLRTLAAWAASASLLAACGGGGGGGGDAASCSLDAQKRFTRTYMDEVYLWYDEIPNVDPNQYDNIPDYFNALRVRTPDVNGRPKDRFSAVIPASRADAVLQTGALQADTSQLLKFSGKYVAANSGETDNHRRFGYIYFRDHAIGAQDELIDAFREVQDAGAQDLVLDLRDNAGGYLYIALAAASMVTGPASNGKVFERLRYNDKREAETEASTLAFSSRVQFGEARYPAGTPLPQLGLTRVFVLTSSDTCSASESIINSLRGIDVQVVRIGDTTCGKPYGFRRKDNCGWAYFPIEFQGTNAKGYGDYTTGFTPNCQVTDTGAAPGGSSDALLAEAKYFIDYGHCMTVTTNTQNSAVPKLSTPQSSRPAWAGRMLLPEQQR